jgi:hypothetical protein
MFGSIRPMVVLAAGVLAIANAPLASAQLVSAGAKNTQALYDCVPFDANGDATVTLTVPYGKKNRMLLVNALTRGISSGQECNQSLVLTVGPASPESFGGSATGRQGGSYTAHGHWWADIDANEANMPGFYYGKPIPVELVVHKQAGDMCHLSCIALDVQMVKK